ncbi:hypothetical protein FHL15_005703 [Xylaria flabelliformis]|uniref:C2H2-type domain-containing protein n=1 Tax=Xylaria flabelliformis TaxID=2512241 RepID=A0A553HZP6_9PEZI|nr:hypothetical protein FHL15_005703 [Xylaria flabelliformis]
MSSSHHTGDNNETFWPERSHPPGSVFGDDIPTIVDLGLVSQIPLFGGLHNTLDPKSLSMTPMTAFMDKDEGYVHTTDNLIGELDYGLISQSAAAIYGSGWGYPHESSPSLLSPSWLPLSPPTSLPPQSPLPSAIPSKPHVCALCPGTTTCFKLKKDLNRHLGTVHATGYEEVYCCRCKKQGVRKDNYLRHVRRCNKERYCVYYTCKCFFVCAEKEEHLDHVTNCQYGLGTPGRSSAS